MERIKLSETDMLESVGHTSKGNQPKWFYDGKFYKADHMGYESLAEVVVSLLLKKTNITNFVEYYPVRIEIDHRTINGCYSYNFLKPGEELIPLERLHRTFEGVGLSQTLKGFDNSKDRIKYTVDFVEKTTGINNYGKYITAMLEIDAFFLNEDRHTNNIALIKKPGNGPYAPCPYFDHGLSLLSDLEAFWPEGSLDNHLHRVTAKPFGTFKGQMRAAQELYEKQLEIHFDKNDIDPVLNSISEYYNETILERVNYILKRQLSN